jgi:hypothetical protein
VSGIVEVTVKDDRPGGGFEYRITPTDGGKWYAEMRPRDPNHWAAGPWDPSHFRPTLIEAIEYIGANQ